MLESKRVGWKEKKSCVVCIEVMVYGTSERTVPERCCVHDEEKIQCTLIVNVYVT